MLPDYYAELELPRDASLEDLQRGVRKQRRRYRQLAGALSVDQRTLAETKMQIIAEAEKAFESEQTRHAYDSQLAQQPSTTAAPPPTTASNAPALDQAKDFFGRGLFRLAHQAAQQATTVNHQIPEAWAIRAESAVELGNLNDAEYAAHTFRDLAPGDPEASILISDIYFAQDRFRDAFAALQEADKLAPNTVFIPYKMAMVMAQDGAPDQAAKLLESTADRLQPDDANLYADAASIQSDAENFDEAARLYAKAFEKSPNDTDLAALQSISLSCAEKYTEAITVAESVVDRDSSPAPAAAFAGAVLDQAGDKLTTDYDGNPHITSKEQLQSTEAALDRVKPYIERADNKHLTSKYNYLQGALAKASATHGRSLGCLGWLLILVVLFGMYAFFINVSNGLDFSIVIAVFLIAIGIYGLYKRVRIPGYKHTQMKLQGRR